jgi:hypothetical protein
MSENLNQSTQENIIPAYIWHDPRVIAGALHNGVSVTIFGGILKFEMMPPGCSQKLNSEGAKYLTPSDREMKAKPITQEKAKELGVEVIVGGNATPEFIYTKNTVIRPLS